MDGLWKSIAKNLDKCMPPIRDGMDSAFHLTCFLNFRQKNMFNNGKILVIICENDQIFLRGSKFLELNVA